MPDEPIPPTHKLLIEVPLALHGPFPGIVVKDCLTAVLSLLRVSGAVVGAADVSLREVDSGEAERR